MDCNLAPQTLISPISSRFSAVLGEGLALGSPELNRSTRFDFEPSRSTLRDLARGLFTIHGELQNIKGRTALNLSLLSDSGLDKNNSR